MQEAAAHARSGITSTWNGDPGKALRRRLTCIVYEPARVRQKVAMPPSSDGVSSSGTRIPSPFLLACALVCRSAVRSSSGSRVATRPAPSHSSTPKQPSSPATRVMQPGVTRRDEVGDAPFSTTRTENGLPQMGTDRSVTLTR